MNPIAYNNLLKLIALFLVLFSFESTVYSQDKSTVDKLLKKCWNVRNSDPQKAYEYVTKALDYSQKINYKIGEAKSENYLGAWYKRKGDYDEAEKHLLKALQLFGQKDGRVSTLQNLGNVYQYTGKYDKAHQRYLEALEINKRLKNTTGVGVSYSNLGGLCAFQKDEEGALDFYFKAVEAYKREDHKDGLAQAYNAISNCYEILGKGDERKLYIEKAISIYESTGNLNGLADCHDNIATTAYYKNDFNTALKEFQNGLELRKKLGDQRTIASSCINIAFTLVMLKRLDEAEETALEGLKISKNIGVPYEEAQAFASLAGVYELAGDYKKAYTAIQRHFSMLDSLKNEKVLEDNRILNKQIELEKKDKVIAQLDKKKALSEAKSSERLVWLSVSIGLLIALLLGGLVFFIRRKSAEKIQRAELEQKALRSQMNPHFIFNSLNAIQDMYVNQEIDTANDYMGDFSKLMRLILEHSDKQLISVKDELDTLQLYLELEKGRTDLLSYEISINPNVDQFNTLIPPLILQPFVENAIWHGILPAKEPGLVKVDVRAEGRQLKCTIEDNGVGINDSFRTSKVHEPKGMQITEQRIGTKIVVEQLDPGTRVVLTIPI